jgi:hypothetical protein
VNLILKRGLAVVGAGALLAGLAACSTTAAPDYVLVRYEKGVNGGLAFESCLQPSQKGDAAVNDQTFALPVSLRTWNIRPEGQGGDSANAVQTGTKPQPATETASAQPGPEVKVFTKTEFFLNTSCKEQDKDGKVIAEGKDSPKSPVARFWEATGRRYEVATDGESGFSEDNWVNMLQSTLVPAMEKAVRASSRNFDADQLDANEGNVWALMEKQMGATFAEELNASVGGGDYFCGPTYRRNGDGSAALVEWTVPTPDPAKPGQYIEAPAKGTCPPVRISITDVVFADPKIAEARAKNYAAEQEANANLTKARSDKAVADLAKDPNVMKLREQQNALDLERERTRQVELCSKTTGAVCIVGGGNTGVNINR